MDKTIANPLRGIMFKVMSLVLFMIMQGLIKEGGKGINAGEVTFFRSAFAMVPIMAWLAWRSQLVTAFHTTNIKGHFIRGSIGVLSMGLGFYGILRLPLPESVALGYAMPLMTVIAGAVLLGETVRLYRWSAVIVGFVGVMIILWPRLSMLGSGGMDFSQTMGAIAILASCFTAALAMVQVRQLVRTENTATIVLYFSLSSALLTLLTVPTGWTMPAPSAAILLICAGFIGGVAQILLTEGYRYADVSTVAPFEYTSIIWATLIGYVFFNEVPTWTVVIGTAIVIASGIFIIMRERRLNIERQRALQVR
jgi:drug/metabolite transporter (DMT)-like permease